MSEDILKYIKIISEEFKKGAAIFVPGIICSVYLQVRFNFFGTLLKKFILIENTSIIVIMFYVAIFLIGGLAHLISLRASSSIRKVMVIRTDKNKEDDSWHYWRGVITSICLISFFLSTIEIFRGRLWSEMTLFAIFVILIMIIIIIARFQDPDKEKYALLDLLWIIVIGIQTAIYAYYGILGMLSTWLILLAETSFALGTFLYLDKREIKHQENVEPEKKIILWHEIAINNNYYTYDGLKVVAQNLLEYVKSKNKKR